MRERPPPSHTARVGVMGNAEIVEKILSGCALRTFMIPDSTIPSNSPEHWEGFDLPHVVINGKLFWAKTASHRMGVRPDAAAEEIAFCYTNSGDFFCSYSATLGKANFMPKARYRHHSWILANRYDVIWDSSIGQSPETVKAHLQAGHEFRIAMLDSEDIWNVHPAHLPMYFPGEDRFDIRTTSDTYPLEFRYPERIVESMRGSIIDGWSVESGEESRLVAELQGFSSYYSLLSDGSYQSFYDMMNGRSHSYKRLLVFADRLS